MSAVLNSLAMSFEDPLSAALVLKVGFGCHIYCIGPREN